MLSGEATKTNSIVFGLARSGLEPMIYHTWGKHANHYATDAVVNRNDTSSDLVNNRNDTSSKLVNNRNDTSSEQVNKQKFVLCYVYIFNHKFFVWNRQIITVINPEYIFYLFYSWLHILT